MKHCKIKMSLPVAVDKTRWHKNALTLQLHQICLISSCVTTVPPHPHHHQLWLSMRFYVNKSHIHKHSCNFRATIVVEPWYAAVWDLFVSSAGKWPLCNGAHLWWHYMRKQVYSGSCLQNRTLSSSSPFTDESPHISVVYSTAGREAHKCGQVLLPKLDLC